jgi:hypothetical protein
VECTESVESVGQGGRVGVGEDEGGENGSGAAARKASERMRRIGPEAQNVVGTADAVVVDVDEARDDDGAASDDGHCRVGR